MMLLVWYLFGVWCLVFGVWCLVFGVWCLVLGAWCLVFGVWCLVFGFCLLSVFFIWISDSCFYCWESSGGDQPTGSFPHFVGRNPLCNL